MTAAGEQHPDDEGADSHDVVTQDGDDQAGDSTRGEPVVPRWWHSQPLGLWWLLPLGFAVAGWLLWGGELRAFGYAVAATLVLAAVLRIIVPRDAVGGLMVRSRAWDSSILIGFALAVSLVTWSLDLD